MLEPTSNVCAHFPATPVVDASQFPWRVPTKVFKTPNLESNDSHMAPTCSRAMSAAPCAVAVAFSAYALTLARAAVAWVAAAAQASAHCSWAASHCVDMVSRRLLSAVASSAGNPFIDSETISSKGVHLPGSKSASQCDDKFVAWPQSSPTCAAALSAMLCSVESSQSLGTTSGSCMPTDLTAEAKASWIVSSMDCSKESQASPKWPSEGQTWRTVSLRAASI
mmetsp:Transcript_129055/g.413508  ORF Transcript_129055/g.413508 Transcript_129055/m.413508 type:complete len:223 (-) Transcript_129055:763-1431(-)